MSSTERPAVLAGKVISGSSLAEELLLFEARVEPSSWLSTIPEDEQEALLLRQKKAVMQGLGKLSTLRTTNTEILDSLDYAERMFLRYPSAESKVLIIFSDMQEQSPRLNMGDQRKSLSTSRVSQFIAQEKKNGMIPDLGGARVIVCGAKAADSRRYREVRQFWIQYFQNANAELRREDYGFALKLD